MKHKYALVILAPFMSFTTFAQPANNTCSGATTLPTNGTCIGGTTVAATDTWVGTVGCAGNNDEVWYTFIATGTQGNVVITSGTLGGNIELTVVEATGPCTGLALRGWNCGPSVMNTTFSGFQVGVRYYFTISSTGANGTFTICNTMSTPPPVPGQDCTTPAVLCNNNSFSQGNFTGVGTAETISTNTCFGSQERQSRWYTFTIGCTGTFGFVIQPSNSSNDIDWLILNTTTGGCYSTGTVIKTGSVACNWSGCPGATGIHTTPSTVPNSRNSGAGCFGSYAAFTTTLPTFTAGNTYTMLIDNYSTSGNGFDVSFPQGTSVIGPSATFTSSLAADCFTLSVSKTCPTTNSTYLWNFGDGTTSTLQNPPAKVYGSTGNYTVSLTVTDALGCVRTTSQNVNVGCLPLPVELYSFNAERYERKTELSWEMISENNNSHFTLYRSLDANTWDKITTVNSIGNHSNPVTYEYVDDNSSIQMDQTIYYQLFQTDFDGTTNLLGTTSLSGINSYTKKINMSISPNPNDGNEATLTFVNQIFTNGSIRIQDAQGKTIEMSDVKLNKGVNNLNIDLSSYPKGVYLISFESTQGSEYLRFVKI